MKLDIKNTCISKEYVQPTLVAKANITCELDVEAPMITSGELLVGGKILSQIMILDERLRNGAELKHISNDNRNRNFREKKQQHYPLKILVPLSKKKISYLCEVRESDSNKSIELTFRLNIKAMSLDNSSLEKGELFQFQVSECISRQIISRENWIKYFTEPLGLGSFYLVELRKPTLCHYNEKWLVLSSAISDNISRMEKCLLDCEWQRTLEISRLFFENIKVGDFKSGSQSYKSELTKELIDLQHDQKGIDNFFKAIQLFFEYTSKFQHEKDKQGNSKPRPIARKEDAYFVYSLAINLSNVVFSKLNNAIS